MTSLRDMPLRQGVALVAGLSIVASFGAVIAAMLGMVAHGRAGDSLRGIGLGVFAVSAPAVIVFVVWYWWLTRKPVNAAAAAIDTSQTRVGDALATTYFIGTLVTGQLIFFGTWIYCIDHYGLLLGLSLGWLPAIVATVVLSWFWPLAILAAVGWIIFVVGFT